jgi:serine kinase of HPr protein (carbohydrate metabolism regulator)
MRQLRGEQAIHAPHRLDLIVKLTPTQQTASHTRLYGDWQKQRVLDSNIPQLTLTMTTSTHLALLIETAARLYVLQRSGYNATHDISARLDNLLTQAEAASLRSV